MKVVKGQNLANQEPSQEGQIDQAKVAEIKERFDILNSTLAAKSYSVSLNVELLNYLLNEFFETLDRKGYESFAVSECTRLLNESRKEVRNLKSMTTDFVDCQYKPEVIEAIFHFLKGYVGKGVKSAQFHKQVCDQFSVAINVLNQDRVDLRDLSLELHAAENGIPVEQLINHINNQKMES